MGLLQTCDKDVSEVSHFEDVQQGGGLEIELGHTGEFWLAWVSLGVPLEDLAGETEIWVSLFPHNQHSDKQQKTDRWMDILTTFNWLVIKKNKFQPYQDK